MIPVKPAEVPGLDAPVVEAFVRWLASGNGRAGIVGCKVGGVAVLRLPAH